jgi:hypothetical protein
MIRLLVVGLAAAGTFAALVIYHNLDSKVNSDIDKIRLELQTEDGSAIERLLERHGIEMFVGEFQVPG